MYCFKWHCHANDAGALYRVGYGVRKEWCLGRVRVRKVVKKLAKTEPGFLGMRQSTHFPPARESGECCKLPQRSPSRNLIWCILAEKLGIWWLHNTDTDWLIDWSVAYSIVILVCMLKKPVANLHIGFRHHVHNPSEPPQSPLLPHPYPTSSILLPIFDQWLF